MRSAAPATAALISLLRLGERSAEIAFDRLSRSSMLATSDPYRPLLTQIARDERRHDVELAAVTSQSVRLRMQPSARRFFDTLRDRDIRIHLARIAALDGCVCQIITQVLSGNPTTPLDGGLRHTLQRIRHDEGRHVRIARDAALHLGATTELLRDFDRETRAAFCGVLEPHADELEAHGMNSQNLLNRLRRDAP